MVVDVFSHGVDVRDETIFHMVVDVLSHGEKVRAGAFSNGGRCVLPCRWCKC